MHGEYYAKSKNTLEGRRVEQEGFMEGLGLNFSKKGWAEFRKDKVLGGLTRWRTLPCSFCSLLFLFHFFHFAVGCIHSLGTGRWRWAWRGAARAVTLQEDGRTVLFSSFSSWENGLYAQGASQAMGSGTRTAIGHLGSSCPNHHWLALLTVF